MGRIGGTLGIVDNACDAGVVVVATVGMIKADETVGDEVGRKKLEPDIPLARAWRAGCRLCGCQSVSEGFQEPRSGDPERTSRAAGCVR